MALNLSNGRRRWACRAACRGGKGGAGCRHFHVHYHVPHQVWAFSLLRLPSRFSLLPYLLILPVLFFALLAFLVCFGWFTLVYFVSSLWSKENDHDLCASNAGKPGGEDGREERAVKRVTEYSVDSGLSEVCDEGQGIKEVFEDGFSEESRHISRMASCGICIDDKGHADEEKIVKEVVIFETNKEELKSFAELDGSSKMHQQVMDIPIDCFLEEPSNREFRTSLSTAKLLNVPYGEDFIANKKDMPVLCSSEILKFIDKHDTEEIIVNGAESNFETPEVPSSDDSAPYGLGDEHRKEIKQQQCTAELSVNSVDNRIAETNLDEWKEIQNSVIEHNNKLAEDDSTDEDGKQTVSISDVANDSLCEKAGLPLDSLWENESETVAASNTPFHEATSDQDGELKEELIKNKRAESSTSAADVCDFANKHWRIMEQLGGFANEVNIQEEDSPETLSLKRVEDEDYIDDNCSPVGASRRLPLIRRSPTQWWHLCGVLDAFAGGED
ncbi:unnamed protein product [Urochloa decumbens]|uniref:Uncharacterized protein n=1 Tax=Urochloa decumbens TaxID=240449 RepID=A0ABC8VZ75_9POAL